MGSGFRTWTSLESLTSSNVQNYLQDQTVMVFATSSARASAITSPEEGMVTYLKDSDGIFIYDGASWDQVFGLGGTVGTDGAGIDVRFWSATAGDYFLWDASEEKLVLEGTHSATVLDVTDGNVVIADGTLTVGSAGAGEDVTFYSDTSGDQFVWDSSAEKLTITGTNATTALDVADGNVTISDTCTAGAFSGPLTGNVTGNASGSSGSCTGLAATATALASARTIGGTSFDGTANIAVALSAEATALETARTIGGVSFDGTANIAVTLAATATALATARTIGGTSFDGTGNIAVALATEATNITAVANNSTAETVYPTFVDGATGTQGIETDTGLTYNPNTGLLTSAAFSGPLTGNVTGNASGTALTVTQAAQTAITSVGTLTGLTLSGDLVVDTDCLFVDVSTNAVGINTTGPIASGFTIGRVPSDEDEGGQLNFEGGTSYAAPLFLDRYGNDLRLVYNGSIVGSWTSVGSIDIEDAGKLLLGTSDDLQIYANGSNSFIDHDGDGQLFIRTIGTGEDMYIQSADNMHLRSGGSTTARMTIDAGGSIAMVDTAVIDYTNWLPNLQVRAPVHIKNWTGTVGSPVEGVDWPAALLNLSTASNYSWNSMIQFGMSNDVPYNTNLDLYWHISLYDSGDAAVTSTSDSTIDLAIMGPGEFSIRTGSADRFRITAAGAVTIGGSLSKGSGSFDIAHPTKGGDWRLRHSFIEGPQADLIYRGTATLSSGTATVDLDAVSGMTDGTWEALNRNPWAMVASSGNAVEWSLSGKTLTITSDTGDAVCSWMVIGERQDDHMKSAEGAICDDDGYLIVEYEGEPETDDYPEWEAAE